MRYYLIFLCPGLIIFAAAYSSDNFKCIGGELKTLNLKEAKF